MYMDIFQLKGVGFYIVVVIVFFVYNLFYVVVDGNVYRVLVCFFDYLEVSDIIVGKKYFVQLV